MGRSVSVDVSANVRGFVSAMKTAQQATTDFGRHVATFSKEHEQAMGKVGATAALAGAGVLAGLGVAVGKWMEFADLMKQAQVASNATSGEMDALSKSALTMGTAFGLSAFSVAQAQIELGKAGLSAKEQLSGGLSGALSLAAAGQLEVGKATEIATSALSQFNLTGKDVPHIADLLAAGANKALGGVSELGEALKQGGLVASSFGISIDETVGTLAAFAQQGLLGSDAGTSMKTMLIALANPSKQAAQQMDELGIRAYDAQGKFVGLAGLAQQLQTGMKDLTQEQRNQALATIFGTDAIRSANVLFKEGAEGIRKWTKDVNDQGYAALAAAKNMDSLNGDWKKFTSTLENSLIMTGKQSDGFLRPVVQQATEALEWLNALPEPLKGVLLGLTGAAGGALLLGGGLMTMIPKISDSISALQELRSSAPRASDALGKIGKAAGGIAATATALVVLGAAITDKHVTSMTDYAEAVTRVGEAGKSAKSSDLDSVFSQWDKTAGQQSTKINGLSEAIRRVTHPEYNDGINRWADKTFAWTGFAQSDTTQVDDRLKGLGDTLGQLATSGGGEQAAQTFRLLSDEFVRNGSTAQDALDHLPGYSEALKGLANSSGVTLSQQELLELAMGRIPAKLAAAQTATEQSATAQEAQKRATEEQAKQLEDLGITLQGVVTDLEKFTQAMSSAGLLELSTRDALRGYQTALDGVSQSIAQNGKSLDIHTKAGRENEAAFDAVAKAGFSVIESMGKQKDAYGRAVYSQKEVQDSLNSMHTDLLKAAGQLGKTGDEAEAAARKVMGIPKDVKIETWISDYAKKMADLTTGSVKAVPGKVDVQSNMDPSAKVMADATKAAVSAISPLASVASWMSPNAMTTAKETGSAVSGIKPQASVGSWMSPNALNVAQGTLSTVNSLDGRVARVTIQTVEQRITEFLQRGQPVAPASIRAPGQATGGAVIGPGAKGVDSELRVLAPGEHVLTDKDVDAMGGQGAVYAFRRALHGERSTLYPMQPALAGAPAASASGGDGGGRQYVYHGSGGTSAREFFEEAEFVDRQRRRAG
ncbi:phage tail tape measure protein [Arthrobacter woluwensis]|uniref:phage tail tape measure protein n=1 Tax=Arthrobacter woluwensis TaxID=156980 RepID=UPI0011A94818|nr:phage tail tape measure protein [Arthrobacter woluwensis]